MKTKNKLLIYKILIFFFAAFVAFMPSTVSRGKEVNSRVIVEILGIDGGDGITVSAQYVMPTDTQGSTGKDTVSVKADTLTEAVEALDTALGRRAELGHCSFVIVGSESTPDMLGTLMTATDVTADVHVAAADGKAADLLGEVTEFMKNTGVTDGDFISYSASKSHIATNTILDFLSDLGSASDSAYMPVLEMLKEESGEQGKSSGGQSGEQGGGGDGQSGGSGGKESKGGGQPGEKEKLIGMKVERLALYNGSGRVGILDTDAARGVAWVSARIEKGIVTADVESDGKTVKDVSGRLLKKHSSLEVDAKKEKVKIKVKAFIEPSGDKYNEIAADTEKANKAVREGFAQAIQKEIEAAIDSAAEMGSDPLFIKRQFYRYAPDYYENDRELSAVDTEIQVEVVLK